MTRGFLFRCGRKTRLSTTPKYLSMKSSCTDAKMKDLKYVTDALLTYICIGHARYLMVRFTEEYVRCVFVIIGIGTSHVDK